jgi:cysteine synthase
MHNTPPGVCDSTLQAIGNTPVVRLHKVVPANSAEVLVKLEYFNPTGSYKDRMALAMIEEAEARGDLRPGMTVVEYTGGSTGSSLAFVCAVKGYPFKVVSSDAFAREKLQTTRAFGAELLLVPSRGGQITPDLVPRMIEEARKLAASGNTYWTNQLRFASLSARSAAAISSFIQRAPKMPTNPAMASVSLPGIRKALRSRNEMICLRQYRTTPPLQMKS